MREAQAAISSITTAMAKCRPYLEHATLPREACPPVRSRRTSVTAMDMLKRLQVQKTLTDQFACCLHDCSRIRHLDGTAEAISAVAGSLKIRRHTRPASRS